MKSVLVVIVAGTLLLSGFAKAQERPTLGLVVEQVGKDADDCNVNRSSVESIAALTLRNNGIQVAGQKHPYLWVQASVVRVDVGTRLVGCAYMVRTEVRSAIFPAADSRIGGFKSRTGAHVAMRFGLDRCCVPGTCGSRTRARS